MQVRVQMGMDADRWSANTRDGYRLRWQGQIESGSFERQVKPPFSCRVFLRSSEWSRFSFSEIDRPRSVHFSWSESEASWC